MSSEARGVAPHAVLVAAGQPLPTLSDHETVLARLLGLADPKAIPSARQFVQFTDLADREPISPPVEAGILRLLAHTPGLRNSGTVTDRAGRRGVAVSVASGYTGMEVLYTLIFDQITGKLLEADDTLAGSPGRLDVRQGSVLAYTTFRASEWVSTR